MALCLPLLITHLCLQTRDCGTPSSDIFLPAAGLPPCRWSAWGQELATSFELLLLIALAMDSQVRPLLLSQVNSKRTNSHAPLRSMNKLTYTLVIPEHDHVVADRSCAFAALFRHSHDTAAGSTVQTDVTRAKLSHLYCLKGCLGHFLTEQNLARPFVKIHLIYVLWPWNYSCIICSI